MLVGTTQTKLAVLLGRNPSARVVDADNGLRVAGGARHRGRASPASC
jgi:hypothetical protein